MKPFIQTLTETFKAPTLVKFTAFTLFSLSLLFIIYYSSSYPPLIFFSGDANTPSTPPPPPSPRLRVVAERTGIVDENGAMALDFKVGEFDPKLAEEYVKNVSKGEKNGESVKVERFGVCDESLREYIPCLDNMEEIKRFELSERGEKYERHCPNKSLDCLVPRPKGYKSPIPWPQSRDEVWFSNVPHMRLVEDKGGQNWIAINKDKFIFPGGGTQFIHGADRYIDQISEMVPDIAFGRMTRVVLDIGCGVASFGAFLMQHNVTTLSIAPKDVHENQIQFALERGVPAMVAVFATRRLLYPSQAFDLIHCSRCRVNWTRHDGILLLEVNRMLRAGGYFVWAAQPVYKHEETLQEQWKEMENLTTCICWELVKREGYIAIWRKPLNNNCYLNRSGNAQPPLCDSSDDPDEVWYIGMKDCITHLPDNGYGANVATWPERLHKPPDRLLSIGLDAYISRRELFEAESKYWNDIVESYVRAYRWKELKLRNIMDMRAGFGGFAAALHDNQINSWVMNIVPVSGFNTLPVINDRGLVGAVHDWCEPFDTYPRTYDMLHAAGLFSIEKKRCNISAIMLEMDRMLRPGGYVYIRDLVTVMDDLQEIATAMGWTAALHETGEGPHASWKILRCEKRL